MKCTKTANQFLNAQIKLKKLSSYLVIQTLLAVRIMLNKYLGDENYKSNIISITILCLLSRDSKPNS